MDIMNGIRNFLSIIDQNWLTITVTIGLVIGLYKKIKEYLAKSDDEKIELALQHVRETMLKFVTESEKAYGDWAKSGSIKRAQVIDELYKQYPVLSKAIDQKEIIKLIDEAIDSALPTLREVLKETKKEE